jgi:hypothetical protein
MPQEYHDKRNGTNISVNETSLKVQLKSRNGLKLPRIWKKKTGITYKSSIKLGFSGCLYSSSWQLLIRSLQKD